MNKELNTNELILLDNLVYLDSNPKFSKGGHKICDIIEDLKSRDGLKANENDKGEYPAQMSKAEWQNILVNISKNDRLM